MVSTATLSSARLGGILELADRSVPYRELASRLEDRQRVAVTDATAGARAFAWSALVAENARTVALVAPSEDRARRCGIIDIYPASAEQPARVELFGDEIETLRAFDPVTQRSQSPLEELIVLPAREFALEGAPAVAEKLIRAGWDRLAHADDDEGADLSPYAILVDALREGGYAPGTDAFAPALGATASLLDHLGDRATVVFEDTVELELAHDALEAQAEERRDELAAQGLPVSVFPPPYVPRSKIESRATEHGTARMGSGPDTVRLGWGGTTSYAGRLADFIGQLATAPVEGVTLIATPQAARLAELLADRDVTAVAQETLAARPATR